MSKPNIAVVKTCGILMRKNVEGNKGVGMGVNKGKY